MLLPLAERRLGIAGRLRRSGPDQAPNSLRIAGTLSTAA